MVSITRQVRSRQYPGEEAALRFLAYVNSLEFPGKRAQYIKIMEGLQRLGRRSSPNPTPLRGADRKAWDNFEHELYDHALVVHPWRFRWLPKRGFVVEYATERIHALLALLELFERGKLARLKQCLHCKEYFYARFKHQKFCADSETNCQWEHYHTAVWRKQHRERNRKHQSKFRERLFPKKEDIDVYL
jgi:hypothetical protein